MPRVELEFSDRSSHSHNNITSLKVDGVTVYTAPEPAPVIPFKVGDFVRVKRNVNVDGSGYGPKARTAGKVIKVKERYCTVEFPGYISGFQDHTRNYFVKGSYTPRHHEALSCIRLIKS